MDWNLTGTPASHRAAFRCRVYRGGRRKPVAWNRHEAGPAVGDRVTVRVSGGVLCPE